MTTHSQRLGAAIEAQGLNRRGLLWLALAAFGTLLLFQLRFRGLAEPRFIPE